MGALSPSNTVEGSALPGACNTQDSEDSVQGPVRLDVPEGQFALQQYFKYTTTTTTTTQAC